VNIPPLSASKILAVDDEQSNIELLESLLKGHGFSRFHSTTDPRTVTGIFAEFHPDLILLDLMMPYCDGFELMGRLQPLIPAGDFLPILVLTADASGDTRIKALGSGATDFLTKPIDAVETLLRIRNLLQTRALHVHLQQQKALLETQVDQSIAMLQQLQQAYQHLQELENLRDNLVHMIVHDMRSPLHVVLMALELLRDNPAAAGAGAANVLNNAWASAHTVCHMATQLLEVSRLEAGQMPLAKSPGNLVADAQAGLDALRCLANGQRLVLAAPEPVAALYDPELVRRLIVNLLNNAIKFTPAGGEITLAVTRDGANARLAVSDTGPGIPAEFHHRIFEKFGQVQAKHRSTGSGLGLAFCRLVVEAHGGQIGVISPFPTSSPSGSSFWFTLPAPAAPA